ncbi:PspA/IM30 family protein [Evansella sp. LMS18]|jgi:phage shock protein A|uniref:PspA/IM30 family protein n=1 Tax=Evansella sp. LMS18 TaxID=2924033 RepID=UPI0020D191EF|nr:PspA/IM30 family protein [Evansella sp. LMS18]UTR11260.1 PspA/IM30 family protein [Evansella sp. LMS18]
MTNVFTRLKDSIAADLHDLLDKKEEANPIAALNQYLRQSEKETEKVRKLADRQYKLIDEFTKEHQKAAEMAAKRKYQAEIASEAGEDEMHEFALSEAERFETRASELHKAKISAQEQLEELERKYEEMSHKLKDMHLRRMQLMGRENIARATHQIDKVTKDSGDASYYRFTEMERFIEGLEHKVNRRSYENSFDGKIAMLEREIKDKAQ